MTTTTFSQVEIPSEPSLLAFPEKLWWIVNDEKCEEINWSAQGTSVIIASTQAFISNVLNNLKSAVFKTKNFASFIRQLNLYGFRKVTERTRRTGAKLLSSKCEFKHPFFQKGRRDLLALIKRQYYSAKKTDETQVKSRTLPPKEAQFGPARSHSSLSAMWNPAMFPSMSFLPWQSSLPAPFALYPPFCNPAQEIAQMQLGVTGSPQSAPALGNHGLTSPAMLVQPRFGAQFEGSGMPHAQHASADNDLRCAGLVFSHGVSPRPSVESWNCTESSAFKSQNAGVAVPSSAPNIVIINNSPPSQDMALNFNTTRNGLFPEHTNGTERKQPLSAQNNKAGLSQDITLPLKRASADLLQPDSQSFPSKENGDVIAMGTVATGNTKDGCYGNGRVREGDQGDISSPVKKAKVDHS